MLAYNLIRLMLKESQADDEWNAMPQMTIEQLTALITRLKQENSTLDYKDRWDRSDIFDNEKVIERATELVKEKRRAQAIHSRKQPNSSIPEYEMSGFLMWEDVSLWFHDDGEISWIPNAGTHENMAFQEFGDGEDDADNTDWTLIAFQHGWIRIIRDHGRLYIDYLRGKASPRAKAVLLEYIRLFHDEITSFQFEFSNPKDRSMAGENIAVDSAAKANQIIRQN